MKSHTLARTSALLTIFASVAATPTWLPAAERPQMATIELPPIWQKLDTRDRLSLVRAAELDATRLLVERINGAQVTSNTTVRQLAEADDKVASEVNAMIHGIKTVGDPVFTPDGRVEVVRKVHLDQVIRKVREIYSRTGDGPLLSDSETTTEKREVVFDVMGSAAIKGSDGHKRIMAKRAAEVDAARRISERMGGVQITAKTNLANFAAEHDEIKSHMVHLIKSAETVKIRFYPDNSAQVTLRVVMDPKVRVIARKIKDGEISLISDKTEVIEIEETGQGAPPTAEKEQTEITIESVVEQSVTGKGDKP